jgi:hypothetical protein
MSQSVLLEFLCGFLFDAEFMFEPPLGRSFPATRNESGHDLVVQRILRVSGHQIQNLHG